MWVLETLRNIPNDVSCLYKVVQQVRGMRGGNDHTPPTSHYVHRCVFLAEEVRLKSGFDHVEGACDDGTAHSSQSSCKKWDMSKVSLISDIVIEKRFTKLSLRRQSAAMGRVAWWVLEVSAM